MVPVIVAVTVSRVQYKSECSVRIPDLELESGVTFHCCNSRLRQLRLHFTVACFVLDF